MQGRFRQLAGQLVPVHFGTFHSVFYHILLESNGFRRMDLLNDSRKKKLMMSVLKGYQDSGEYSEDAVRILSAISLYKNTADRERAAAAVPTEWRERFAEITASYTEAVREAGAVDFDDMLFECRRMLAEDTRARQSWQARFRHILIDEFQDCNPVQYDVIRLLSAKPHHIFAVGDDDQSIYGFRGAEPDILRQFTEDYRARRLLLDVNYRSTEEIVEASLAVIGENKNRFPKALRAASGSGGRAEAGAGRAGGRAEAGGTGEGGRAEAGKERTGGRAEAGAGESAGVQLRSFQDRAAQEGWLLQQAGTGGSVTERAAHGVPFCFVPIPRCRRLLPPCTARESLFTDGRQ